MFANRPSDITTEQGKEQITSKSTALSTYIQKMDDYRRETMEVLYTNTVDRQCLPACEQDEVAFFMVCSAGMLPPANRTVSTFENSCSNMLCPFSGLPTTSFISAVRKGR